MLWPCEKTEHRPAAASQRSLQACIASLPLQSSLMSKTYLKSDHFSGGGSLGASFSVLPPPRAYSVSSIELISHLSRRLYKWHGFRCRCQQKRNERSQR